MARTRANPFRTVASNHEVLRVVLAYFVVVLVEWAIWVALLVHTYDASGATATGLVSLGLLLPGIFVAPLTGAALNGRRPNRVLPIVCAVMSANLGIAALAILRGWPLIAIVVPAAVALSAIAVVRPCVAVVVPDSVRTATELTAANRVIGHFGALSALLGPLLASALIAWDGPGLVLWVGAALVGVATAISLPLAALDKRDGVPVTDRPSRQPAARTRELVRAMHTLTSRPGGTALLVLVCSQYVVVGALDLIFVLLAAEQFDMGETGPGLLQAAFGVGGILGGVAAALLLERARVAPTLLAVLATVAGATALLAGSPRLALAMLVFPVVGLGRTVLEVTGRTLLQRLAPQDGLASVFAVVESLGLFASVVGSGLAQVMIAFGDARAALVAISVFVAAILLLTATGLVAADGASDVPIVTIRLLRRIPVFAMLHGAEIESVARAAEPKNVPAGTVVMRQGDPGDSYFAIVDGTVSVAIDGAHVRTMTRGQGFGEIALIMDRPRTATVVADTPVDLLEIDRESFLRTVSENAHSRQAAWSVARTWIPHHDDPWFDVP